MDINNFHTKQSSGFDIPDRIKLLMEQYDANMDVWEEEKRQRLAHVLNVPNNTTLVLLKILHQNIIQRKRKLTKIESHLLNDLARFINFKLP